MEKNILSFLSQKKKKERKKLENVILKRARALEGGETEGEKPIVKERCFLLYWAWDKEIIIYMVD